MDSYAQAWGMLAIDRIDLYIDALIDVEKYIRDSKVDMTPYELKILWSEKMYVAFNDSERSKKLISIYDKRIIELFNSGGLKKIYEKWEVRYPDEAWKK